MAVIFFQHFTLLFFDSGVHPICQSCCFKDTVSLPLTDFKISICLFFSHLLWCCWVWFSFHLNSFKFAEFLRLWIDLFHQMKFIVNSWHCTQFSFFSWDLKYIFNTWFHCAQCGCFIYSTIFYWMLIWKISFDFFF